MNECLMTPQNEKQNGYWVSEEGKQHGINDLAFCRGVQFNYGYDFCHVDLHNTNILHCVVTEILYEIYICIKI